MDFFQSQDKAKSNTTKLIVLFSLAVVSIIILTNLLVLVVFGFIDPSKLGQQRIDWSIFAAISAGVLIVISLGSAYKMNQLTGGGDRIAAQMDGELIVPDSGDFKKQRLLNIVEEMAIASGVPVPTVYMVPGNAINAFAAGHTYSNAVIGVSKGAIEKLPRDELQGVIAHEFSHILNGDMRINIRLMGVLHGILVIGLIGHYLLRSSSSSRRSSKGSGGAVFLGLGLVCIGYSGTFFGNWIKAAVNRQREFLADSAAVQFTRNPDGIAGALIRIGSVKNGSVLTAPNMAQISHALFSQGFTFSLTQFFATHPPLEKRIKRILPSWDGEFKPIAAEEKPPKEPRPAAKPREKLDKVQATMIAGAAILSGEQVAKQVGRPTADHVDNARKLLKNFPEDIKTTIHSSYGAQAVLYALLLDKNAVEREKQLNYLKTSVDETTYKTVKKQAGIIASLEAGYRLPLIDLALPSLRQLSAAQYAAFRKHLRALIAADQKVNIFEWTLQKIVIHHLDAVFTTGSQQKKAEPNMMRAKEAGTIILSLFVNNFKQKDVSRRDVLAAALKEIQWIDMELLGSEKISLKDLDGAMNDLAGLKPRYKEMLIAACAAVVMADNHVSVQEKELLRALTSGIDCPMPILLN
jgi:Zn-dependent protease with chaperone function